MCISDFIVLHKTGERLKLTNPLYKGGIGVRNSLCGKNIQILDAPYGHTISPQSSPSRYSPQFIRRLCAPNKTNIGISKEILWRRGLKINLKIIIKKETAAINRRTINT